MSIRLILAGIAVVVVMGCGSQQPANPAASRGASAQDAAGQEDVEAGNFLAKRSESYSHSMQERLAAHPPARSGDLAGAASVAPVAPKARPVEVNFSSADWLDKPWDFRLGLPQRDDVAAAGRSEQAATGPLTSADKPAPAAAPLAEPLASAGKVDVGSIMGPPKSQPVTEALENKLSQAARDYPRDLSPQLDYQLLKFLQGKSVPQLSDVGSLSADERELLSAIMDELANLRSAAQDARVPLAKRVRPVVEATERIRQLVGLSIPTIVLCNRVDGFGVYEPIATNHMPAGREHAVVVYCEVENFASRTSAAGSWETELTQEVVIYNDASARVAGEKQQSVVDQSHSRRHDFFLARRVRLPASLPPGNYAVRVTICDQQAKRVAEATAPVVITADKEK